MPYSSLLPEWCLVIRRLQRLAGHLNVVEGTAKLHVVGIPLIHVEQVDPQAAGSPQQPRVVPDLGDGRHSPLPGLDLNDLQVGDEVGKQVRIVLIVPN